MCIQGTISVGATKGGNTGPFLDELACLNYLPNADGKSIDVVCPMDCFAGGTPDPDQPYAVPSTTYFKFNGTSASGNMIAGLLLLYLQKYSDLPAEVCYQLMLQQCRTAAGYPFPQLSIL
jgi:hypothetical protein